MIVDSREQMTRVKEAKRLSILAFIIPIIVYIAGGFIGGGLIVLLSQLTGLGAALPPDVIRLLATLSSVAFVTAMIFIAKYAMWHFKMAIDLGVRGFKFKWFAVAVGFVLVLLVVSYSLDWMYEWLGLQNLTTRNDAVFGSQSIWQLGVNMVIAGALTAWLEELLFRGFMYDALKKSSDPIISTLVVSVVFAAIHFSVLELPFLALFSLVLCWFREKTSSLWPGVVVHAFYNASVLAIEFFLA